MTTPTRMTAAAAAALTAIAALTLTGCTSTNTVTAHETTVRDTITQAAREARALNAAEAACLAWEQTRPTLTSDLPHHLTAATWDVLLATAKTAARDDQFKPLHAALRDLHTQIGDGFLTPDPALLATITRTCEDLPA